MKDPIEITTREGSFKVLKVGYAIATKLAAFRTRGKSDHYMSHELEDIIAIFDGNSQIVEQLIDCHGDSKLKIFLQQELSLLMQNAEFLASVEGHINDRNFARERSMIVVNRIKKLLENFKK